MDPTSQMDRASVSRGAREDLELVRLVIQREPAALQEFLQRMHCVWRILAYKNKQYGHPLSEDEVEDVAQEALLAVWRNLESYEGRGALEAWVHRICFLELLVGLRARRRGPRSLDEGEEPGSAPTIDPLVAERIYLALDRLEPAAADVVRLKHFAGMTFEEIGERLRVSPNSAKTRYYRSLERLRESLSDLRPHGAPEDLR